jgi:DNA invertase Pin-like site-specific DNA recombinase
VNPDHLFLGTPADNTRDAVSKKRMATGERNGKAKLTREQIEEIRRLYSSSKVSKHPGRCAPGTIVHGSSTEIGKRFGIAGSQVRRIVNGERWAHIH